MPDTEREFNEARERLNAIIRDEGNPEIRRSFASDSRVLRSWCVARSYHGGSERDLTARAQKAKRERLILVLAAMGVLLTTAARPAASQFPEFTQFHTWTDIATIYNFSDRFRYDGDYGVRGFFTDRNWTLVYLRPSVRYRLEPWLRLHGGAALFYNFFGEIDDLPELRPWLGVRFAGPRPGGFVITNYFRLELRAFYLKGSSAWDVGLRGRWQLQVTSPRFSIGSAKEFYALTSIEPFFELGSPVEGAFGSRFRYNIGIGKAVNQGLRIDLNYLFHRVRVTEESGDLTADDHVARLRFFYSLN